MPRFIALTCLLLAACPGGDDPGEEAGDTGKTSDDTVTDSGAAGEACDYPTHWNAWKEGGAPGLGRVFMDQYPSSVAGLTATAVFDYRADDLCEHTVAGDCMLSLCEVGKTEDAAPPLMLPEGEGLNAGTITIDGAGSTITLTAPADGGGYSIGQNLGPALQGGETLTIKAEGAFVPAFEGSLAAPKYLTAVDNPLTGPAPGTAATLQRSQTYTMTWESEAPGELVVVVVLPSPDSRLAEVECRAPASGGKLTIPGSLFADVPDGKQLYGIVKHAAESRVAVGDWCVWLQLHSNVVDIAGNEIFGLQLVVSE